MSFDAYYYSFEPTGNADVDAILEAVAIAGKGAHHTEDWHEYGFDKEIQDAANKAALNIAALAQKESAAPGDAMAALTTEGMIELFDTIARKHGITEMSANNGRSDSMIPLVLAELFHAIAQSSAALAQPVAVDAKDARRWRMNLSMMAKAGHSTRSICEVIGAVDAAIDAQDGEADHG